MRGEDKAAMQIGFNLPSGGPLASAENLTRLAQGGEALGFGYATISDHVVIPANIHATYPYTDSGEFPASSRGERHEQLTEVMFVAARTTKLRLVTSVMVVPHRPALLTAKILSTIDVLSGGRLTLGIGAGWLEEEFKALGVPFAQRGKRADDYVAAMRALWAEGVSSHHGPFVNFDRMHSNPKPVRGAVPIIVGGHTEAAARRAGRLGDAFFPSIGAQVDTFPLVEIVRASAVKAGRDPAAVELITGCPGALPNADGDPLAAVEERRRRGVGRVVLPLGPFLPNLEETLPAFGERVNRAFS